MKELNNFRKFLTEEKLNENRFIEGDELLALVKDNQRDIIKQIQKLYGGKLPIGEFRLQGEIVVADAGTPGTGNDHLIRIGSMSDLGTPGYDFPDGNTSRDFPINKKGSKQGFIGPYDASDTSGGGKATLVAALDDKVNEGKEEIKEGTWALGSVAEMVKVMGKLEQIRKMGAAKGSIELENIDTALYNVFGDDSFIDAIDAAKGTDDDDRFNNFIGDAQSRAKELLDGEVEYRKERGETGMEFKPRFGLEENDAVLDEVSESIGIFKEIDMMIGSIKDQMDPDEAFDSLVSEFEATSGGPKLLRRALKNIALDNNLMEEKDEE